jgi:hypothetical protein
MRARGAIGPDDLPQPARGFRHAHGGDLARVGDGPHPRLAQALAADAEHLDVRQMLAERGHQVCRVQVAGSLPGDEQDAATPGRGGPVALRLRVGSGRRHQDGAACTARASISTLSRMTCATSSARSPSHPVTGGGACSRTAWTKAVNLRLERVGLGHLALLEGERRLTVRTRLAAADAYAPLVVIDR